MPQYDNKCEVRESKCGCGRQRHVGGGARLGHEQAEFGHGQQPHAAPRLAAPAQGRAARAGVRGRAALARERVPRRLQARDVGGSQRWLTKLREHLGLVATKRCGHAPVAALDDGVHDLRGQRQQAVRVEVAKVGERGVALAARTAGRIVVVARLRQPVLRSGGSSFALGGGRPRSTCARKTCGAARPLCASASASVSARARRCEGGQRAAKSGQGRVRSDVGGARGRGGAARLFALARRARRQRAAPDSARARAEQGSDEGVRAHGAGRLRHAPRPAPAAPSSSPSSSLEPGAAAGRSGRS